MTTLKLKKSSTPSAPASRSPVRRPDPAKRVRTSAPKPHVHSEDTNQLSEQAAKPARQRNHRHDGKLHAPDPREHHVKTEQQAQDKSSSKRGFEKSATASANRTTTNRDADHRNAENRGLVNRDTPRRGGKVRDGFEPGDFNRDRATNPMFSPKPVPSNPDFPRLSKRMAELGLCSRREADEWIVNGWVKVDGVMIDQLGTRVAPDARIEISKAAEKHQSEIVTILLHKPVGYVSGQAEDGYEPAVVLVHPDNHWPEDGLRKEFKRGYLKGLAPAGRLDIDSTGLLVLTQDGRIARQLIGEDSTIEKEYLVRVEGTLSEAGLKQLNHGLSLDGVELKPAKVSWQNEDQLRFVLREGRKRQIRRMCELVGLHVVGLKRVRIGSVTLGKLPLGQWRYLRPGEKF